MGKVRASRPEPVSSLPVDTDDDLSRHEEPTSLNSIPSMKEQPTQNGNTQHRL